jgi:hypothetical protein
VKFVVTPPCLSLTICFFLALANRACCEQQLHDVDVAAALGERERVELLEDVELDGDGGAGAGGQQRAHDVGVAALRRQHERREAGAVGRRRALRAAIDEADARRRRGRRRRRA